MYIYALVDPRFNKIRYIGKSVDPCARLKHHLTPSSLRRKTHKNHWLRQLVTLSLKPTIKIIEKVTSTNWQNREIYWISYYKTICELTNGTSGGDGLLDYAPSKETREKIRVGNLGKIPWIKGKTHSNQVKQQLSKKMIGNSLFLGKHHSKVTKNKIRSSMPDRTGNSNPFYGKTHSDRTIKKMKLAWKKRKLKKIRYKK